MISTNFSFSTTCLNAQEMLRILKRLGICAEALVKLNILKGYEDGTLRLDNKILRSEFVTLVVRLKGYHHDADIDSIKINFNDIEEKHWAYNNIKLAVKYGIVTGYPDNTIKPNNNVTYAEL